MLISILLIRAQKFRIDPHFAATVADGTFITMPVSFRNLVNFWGETLHVKATITGVTDEQLVLISDLVAGHTDLAVVALPFAESNDQ